MHRHAVAARAANVYLPEENVMTNAPSGPRPQETAGVPIQLKLLLIVIVACIIGFLLMVTDLI